MLALCEKRRSEPDRVMELERRRREGDAEGGQRSDGSMSGAAVVGVRLQKRLSACGGPESRDSVHHRGRVVPRQRDTRDRPCNKSGIAELHRGVAIGPTLNGELEALRKMIRHREERHGQAGE